jgi:hypothetical protein
MAKASESLVAIGNPHNPAIIAAAAEIIGLINSKANSPTRDEIAAIIAKAALPARAGDQPKHRAEWDALMAACKAAEPSATDEEMAVAAKRLDDCARRICSEPVRGPADVMLLAEVCYWAFWTDSAGLAGPKADAFLIEGAPHGETEICDETIAALLKGVRTAFGNVAPT